MCIIGIHYRSGDVLFYTFMSLSFTENADDYCVTADQFPVPQFADKPFYFLFLCRCIFSHRLVHVDIGVLFVIVD